MDNSSPKPSFTKKLSIFLLISNQIRFNIILPKYNVGININQEMCSWYHYSMKYIFTDENKLQKPKDCECGARGPKGGDQRQIEIEMGAPFWVKYVLPSWMRDCVFFLAYSAYRLLILLYTLNIRLNTIFRAKEN